MKYIIFSTLVLFLIACGGNDTTPNAPTTPATPVSNNTQSGSGIVTPPVPTHIKKFAKTPDPNRKFENPNIQFEIEGLGSGKCFLIGVFTDQFFRVDSSMANGGKVVFKSNEPYKPGLLYMMLPDNKTTIQLLVDTDQTFSMKTKMNDLINSMKVEGSLENQLLYQTLKFEEIQRPKFNSVTARLKSAEKGSAKYDAIRAEQDMLTKERKSYLERVFTENPTALFSAFKEAGQNPELERKHRGDGSDNDLAFMYEYKRLFWSNVNFEDERLLYTPVISNKLKRYINELTPQNPDSIKVWTSFLVDQTLNYPEYYKYFANWVTLNYEPTKTSLMDSEAVFVHMIQNYFTYDRAFWSDSTEVHSLQLRAYEMSNSLVGQKGPNIKAPDPDGNLRSLFDLDANYLIVYMWNPECEHCAEQTPQLVQAYNQWKPRGIDVYGIAVNTEDKAWKDAIKQYKMPWVNVFDPTNKSIYATYFVDNTPEVYVLNPDRIIIGKNLKIDQIMTVVERDMEKRGLN